MSDVHSCGVTTRLYYIILSHHRQVGTLQLVNDVDCMVQNVGGSVHRKAGPSSCSPAASNWQEPLLCWKANGGQGGGAYGLHAS